MIVLTWEAASDRHKDARLGQVGKMLGHVLCVECLLDGGISLPRLEVFDVGGRSRYQSGPPATPRYAYRT